MIKKLLQEGFILKSKGYYKHAIESFYKALEKDNSSTELLLEIAECYYLMNDEERTLNYIEQVLDKDPSHIAALKLLKKGFVNKLAWNEAEQTAKNIFYITKEAKDLAEIFRLLNIQGHYSEIFEYNSEFETASIMYEKAYAKLYLNELAEAENYINKALELNCDDKNVLLKGKILYKRGRLEECLDIINNIQINENDYDMLSFAGLVKQQVGDFDEAIEYFLKALKLDSERGDCYYNCASTYFKMGDLDKAKKYYNLAISISPDNQNYHFALANLYYSEKQYKRALEELNYDFYEAKLLKSIILYDSGYLAIAKKVLDKLMEEQPENELALEYCRKIEEELKI